MADEAVPLCGSWLKVKGSLRLPVSRSFVVCAVKSTWLMDK
jgi:hypothetical protein